MNSSQLLIVTLILSPLAGNFFAEWSMLAESLGRWIFYRRYTHETRYNPAFIRNKVLQFILKAISCPMCLSGHLTWITLLSLGEFHIWLLIVCTMASGGMGMIINKLVNKI